MSRIRGAAAAAFLAALLLGACGKNAPDDRIPDGENLLVPEEANYGTVQTRWGDYVKTAAGALQVYYPVNAELCREEDGARLRELLVRTGQEVKAGDCLATFDIEVSKANREELRLSLTRKREELASGAEERQSAMQKAWTEMRDDDSRVALLKMAKLETEYEQFVYLTEREITRLQEELGELEEKIADNALLAPFDGVIDNVTSSHNAGDPVRAGEVLITMHATDRYYLVAEDESGKLRYNTEVTVEAGKRSARKTYKGKVAASSDILPPTVPDGAALIELYEKVPLEDLKGSLQYQFNAEELQNVLLVDWSAVETENGKNHVYVLENDMVQKRYIVPGLNDRITAWVLDGLVEGQTLIAD